MVAGLSVETNAFTVAAELQALGVVASARAGVVTQQFGSLLAAGVRQNAQAVFSHERRTNYMSRIQLDVSISGVITRAAVFSDHPGAGRDEFGFQGTDSRGRHVEQPPRPHFRPALAALTEPYTEAIAQVLDGV